VSERRDWAVILARGESRRMGRPKGLCRLPGEARSFLTRIVDLYGEMAFPLAVVTTAAMGEAYRAELPGAPVRWLERPAGRGTAFSVVAALEALAAEATHLWLHPVDLPRVTAASLDALLARSAAEPGTVLVPEREGRPGHPVVLPVAPFLRLRGVVRDGDMRPWLLELTAPGPDRMAPLVAVPLRDEGIVTDYDSPASLT
jgi:CTP:molybdopterin cytidylyltransferase MocA